MNMNVYFNEQKNNKRLRDGLMGRAEIIHDLGEQQKTV